MRSSPSRDFEAFCATVGLELEPFQRRIVKEVFNDRRELLVLLPRGNGKTHLLAALALHHLVTTDQPAVYCAAASRDQARLLFEAAQRFATRLDDDDVVIRYREIRARGGFLRPLASDAPKLHGLTPSFVVTDELHAHKDDQLYLALRTAMLKRPGARMVVISTAGHDTHGPLARLRARALGLPAVKRTGALTRTVGPSLAMLEWSVPDDADIDSMKVVKRANPASWVTKHGLAEQREAVHDLAFRRFHCNQWTLGLESWLPAGSWQACADPTLEIEPGEDVYVGVDVGGTRASSAVVWVTEDLRLGVRVWNGDDAVLHVAEHVRGLADTYTVREVGFDPWRFRQAALELEQAGLTMVEFPQSHSRMVPASERLYAAISEGRLRHPGDPELDRQVALAVAKDTGRGWRIDKRAKADQVDAVVALAMALERAEAPAPKTELLGWL